MDLVRILVAEAGFDPAHSQPVDHTGPVVVVQAVGHTESVEAVRTDFAVAVDRTGSVVVDRTGSVVVDRTGSVVVDRAGSVETVHIGQRELDLAGLDRMRTVVDPIDRMRTVVDLGCTDLALERMMIEAVQN